MIKNKFQKDFFRYTHFSYTAVRHLVVTHRHRRRIAVLRRFRVSIASLISYRYLVKSYTYFREISIMHQLYPVPFRISNFRRRTFLAGLARGSADRGCVICNPPNITICSIMSGRRLKKRIARRPEFFFPSHARQTLFYKFVELHIVFLRFYWLLGNMEIHIYIFCNWIFACEFVYVCWRWLFATDKHDMALKNRRTILLSNGFVTKSKNRLPVLPDFFKEIYMLLCTCIFYNYNFNRLKTAFRKSYIQLLIW